MKTNPHHSQLYPTTLHGESYKYTNKIWQEERTVIVLRPVKFAVHCVLTVFEVFKTSTDAIKICAGRLLDDVMAIAVEVWILAAATFGKCEMKTNAECVSALL